MTFGGFGGIAGYLNPNRWADPASTNNTTSGVATRWNPPASGSLTAFSNTVTLNNGVTTVSFLLNGVVQQTTGAIATSTTQFFTLATPIAVTTAQYLEVRTNTQSVGACIFSLYFT
jgi:hypothetical protein